jgi:poly(A) polymerase
MIKLKEMLSTPRMLYHSYEGNPFDISRIDFDRGLFTIIPWWVGKKGYEQYGEFHPNEFGDRVVALEIDPKVKTLTVGDQFDLVEQYFPNGTVKQDILDKADRMNDRRDWQILDTLIGRFVKKKGYKLIHYTDDQMYGDVFVILDKSVIKNYWHKGESPQPVKEHHLLVEGVKEKAAEDFIRKTIKGTEWEGIVYIAGGYVRDEFLGIDPKDMDLVVNAPDGGINFANWITKKVGAYKEGSNPVIASKYGTAKFNLRGVTHNGEDLSDLDIEAVMPRKEQYTDPDSRNPDVQHGTMRDDAERRDFTVNSLMKDLSNQEILDLTGHGKEDIKKGVVRTAIQPDQIFSDDPLRMLRAIRFAMKYNWQLPLFMVRAIKKNAPRLEIISKERIKDELNKMLLTGSPERAIKLLKITGLIKYVIPELVPSIKMTQNIHHVHDVFTHTLDVLSKTKPVLVQRLMGLFHDIGKTVTRSVTPSGVHFYQHEDEGAKIARQVMERLRYPNELIAAVVKGVENHMRLKGAGDEAKISDKALRKFRVDMGEQLDDVLDLIHADNISHSDESAMPNQINIIRARLATLDMNLVRKAPKLPINGNDLIAMGLKPGPIFTAILGRVTDAWYENPGITREQALEIVRKAIGR